MQDNWGAGIAVAKAISASLAAFAAFLANKVGALLEPGMWWYVVALASTESMRTQILVFQNLVLHTEHQFGAIASGCS